MQIFTLIGVYDYSGAQVIGNFGTMEDLHKAMDANLNFMQFDHVGYLVTTLGETIESSFDKIVYFELDKA